MTERVRDEDPGSWIALGLRDAGPCIRDVPQGYDAYAKVIHDRETTEPPAALSQAKLRLLVTILGDHTSTQDTCFFGQWTVWGYLERPTRIWIVEEGVAHAHDPEPRAEHRDLRSLQEKLDLGSGFTYQLFSGPLVAAHRVGTWFDEDRFSAHAPDLIWPQDRAWCVRRDGDSDTVVAGTPALINEVLAHPELDSQLIQRTIDTSALSCREPRDSADERVTPARR